MENLENILFYNIEKSIRSYRNFSQQKLRKNQFPISIDQWLILKTLEQYPTITQNKIGMIVFKDNATITRLIDQSVNAGIIEKMPNLEDRRRAYLEITEGGYHLLDRIQNIINKNREVALNGITMEEISMINSALKKISNNCINAKI